MKSATRFLVVLVIMCCLANMFSTSAFADEELPATKVTFRVVLYNHMAAATCSVQLARYANATDVAKLPNSDYENFFSIRRADNWEFTLELPAGFYEVDYVGVTGSWSVDVSGSTKRFEVKGDKMTVYIAVDNPERRVEMPPNWLVYGEDNQNFYIWDTTPDTPVVTPPDTSENPDSPNPDTDTTTPPTPDTGVEENTNTPNRDPVPPASSPNITPDDDTEEKPLSAKIGDYAYIGLAVIILVVCLILYGRIRKERGA